MKLYEISELYHDFMNQFENGEIPEEVFNDTLEAIETTFDEKADNIACLIKSYEAEAAAINDEISKLQERKKTKQNQAERLKTYLSSNMQKMHVRTVETPRVKLSFRKSEAVEVTDELETITALQAVGRDDCLTYKAPTINKTALKAAIKAGETFSGVALVTRENLQIK